MQNTTNDISFDDIANNIINTKKFNELKSESHHGLTRYIHVMRVSKFTYKITKKLKLDYISATRAALLHDYFIKEDVKKYNEFQKLCKHSNIALDNAKEEFELNDKEKNAIKSHMFPLGSTFPKYKESWILSIIDKIISTYEQYKYKWKNAVAVYLIFVINMILFGQK